MLKAQCIKNGKYVAIKCMKNHFDSLDQVNNLREIQALRRLSPHGNIIKLLEVLYDQPTGRLALVFELMDMNIYELIRGRRHYVAEDRVKTYLYQLTKSMDHMHRNGIFHRDIKPENILIMDDCLKLADFGSCRGIYSKQPYTEYISTRWYRAPECLLTDGYYNYKMDMWGVGCVFFEIVSLFPLFPGTNELDQIQKIHNIIGTPSAELLGKMKQRSAHMDFNFPQKSGSGIEKLIPHATPECIDLIDKLLAYNPDDRLSARQALRHPYFREIREMEKRQYALMNPKADGTLSGSGGDDSRKGHHGSAVTSSDARSDRTRRSRASASVASTSVPSIAGKGIGEGIGGYEPGGGHRRSQPGGSHRSHGGAGSSVHSGYHAGASSYHGGSDASSIISAGGISLGGVSAARSGGYGSGAAELGVQGVGGGRNVKPVGGAREPVKLGGGYGGVAGSSYGGSYKRESKPGARGSRLEPPSGVGGHKAPVSHRSDKYVSPYGQQRR